jgi:peptide chain release factor 3
MTESLSQAAQRRRTFAIISHPDSGKTTLTEKLLLYAKAIHLAGSIKARRATRNTVSDWMAMEAERGISVTSSVLQFEHRGRALNLLDTPGHADFSEDTYRTLAAVDSALMLMDHSRGVEARTKRLFEVCRMRKVPVISFMNKLDRHGMDPIELVDDVTEQLDLQVAPITWPIGMGRDFLGVVDVQSQEVTAYQRDHHGTEIIESRRMPWQQARETLPAAALDKVEEDLELIRGAGVSYDHDAFLRGELSPMFWGSAMTNFGVDGLLEFLCEDAAQPGPRMTEVDEVIEPTDERFSGFVFKIQANMNPRHRDRVAFLRVVSGRCYRGLDASIGRSGRKFKLSRPHFFLAQERSVVEEAFPGDIVGLWDTGKLRVGDSLSDDGTIRFAGIPRFASEHFRQAVLRDPLKRKSLDTGLEQLSHEGVIQLFYRPRDARQNPVLGAVGVLQFEVLRERLKKEYNVNAELQNVVYQCARWVGGSPEGLAWLERSSNHTIMQDRRGQPVVLAKSEWAMRYALDNAPGLELYDVEPL